MEQFSVPRDIQPGAALCRVRMATICASDLHTFSGRRHEPSPSILGHEIVGEVVALGEGLDKDGFGNDLRLNDRVSWSIMASCGRCFYCTRGLPQKCERGLKYGHMCCNDAPHLTGGFAEYIHLFPGTAIYRIPDGVSDAVAAPANCALATAINAVETIDLCSGETVLVQGAGMLGLNVVALACSVGATDIIVTDSSPDRLKLAAEFGATLCLEVNGLNHGEVASTIRERVGGYGVDVAFELCGSAAAVREGAAALRIGGRYIIVGLVLPDSDLGIAGNQLIRQCLTVKGIHNYRPEHLGQAIKFLESHVDTYPYALLVGETFSLSRVNDAFSCAASGDYIRVALSPNGVSG